MTIKNLIRPFAANPPPKKSKETALGGPLQLRGPLQPSFLREKQKMIT